MGAIEDRDRFGFGLTANPLAQALMAAIALSRLELWRRQSVTGRALWSSTGWIASFLLIGSALGWLASQNVSNAYLVAALGLLSVFGLSGNARLRRAVIAALLLLQGANLFLAGSQSHIRPGNGRDGQSLDS